MPRLTPRSSRGLAAAGGLAGAAAVAVFLSGCSGTTYGTGVDPGTQTLKDIAGIALIGGGKKPTIDYEPRADVVAPPPGTGTTLPPPGAGTTATASAGGVADPPNWPHDPDLAAAKFKADIAAREARGEAAPKFKLPPGTLPAYNPQMTSAQFHDPTAGNKMTPEQQAAAKKAFADAKASVGVDANGNPIRRYLTDPPLEYRQPDPTQPTAFTEKKKKFHWWWQKQDDAGNLTPDASANASTSETGTASSTN